MTNRKVTDIYKNMNSINQILQDASNLPEHQRLTLVNRLLILSEPKATDEVRHAWDSTIRDRIARYDRGEISSRPADDVFSELDRRLNR